MAKVEVVNSGEYLRAKKQCPINIVAPRKRAATVTSLGDDDCVSSLFERSYSRSAPEHRYFVPQFQLPSTSNVRNRLFDSDKSVCLKSFMVTRWHLSGTIWANDIATGKRVFVRYTLDNWGTRSDIEATYLDTDEATGANRYHFRLDFPFRLPRETKLQLAVASCISGGQTHWDNNDGINYNFVYKFN